ncbi:hypothetical protein F4561_004477 [Lipingzhangella halophila]|uniref:Uncharacterized protein n=1 Tax=Lipingzhangella halophila TaxID=1783352 RepID=A0A7W7W430_9ACTN|nr:hypothetical protein [Lipingzhangella halophila]
MRTPPTALPTSRDITARSVMWVRGAVPDGAARTVVGRPPGDRFGCPVVTRPTIGGLARGWGPSVVAVAPDSGETRRNGRVWVRGPRRGCPWGQGQRRECPRGHSRWGPSPRTSAQSPSMRAPPPDGSTGARKGTVPTGPAPSPPSSRAQPSGTRSDHPGAGPLAVLAALVRRPTTHPHHRSSGVATGPPLIQVARPPGAQALRRQDLRTAYRGAARSGGSPTAAQPRRPSRRAAPGAR